MTIVRLSPERHDPPEADRLGEIHSSDALISCGKSLAPPTSRIEFYQPDEETVRVFIGGGELRETGSDNPTLDISVDENGDVSLTFECEDEGNRVRCQTHIRNRSYEWGPVVRTNLEGPISKDTLKPVGLS